MALSRRGFLRGLMAAPAVVAVAHLMPVRGIVMSVDPMLALLEQRIRNAERTIIDSLNEMIYGDAHYYPGGLAALVRSEDDAVIFPWRTDSVPVHFVGRH